MEPQVYKLKFKDFLIIIIIIKFKEFHVLSCASNYEYHKPTTVAALGAAFPPPPNDYASMKYFTL